MNYKGKRMKCYENQYIWTEKYRPRTLEDLILPKSEKKKIEKWFKDGEIPNIGIFGSIPGTGKSSMLNVIIESLDVETLWLNGSKDNGIDVMRNDIGNFIKGKSVMGKHKLVSIDEADYLTINAQTSLRPDVENYSKNVRFMLTGNYPDRIIEPLLNRLEVFDLDDIYSSAKNKKELGTQIYNRLVNILNNENVKFDNKDVLKVVSTLYPSSRSMLLFLQNHTVDGVLEFDNISKPDDAYVDLITAMKARKFKDIKTAVDGIMIPDNFYSYVYKKMNEIFKVESQPSVIFELADYQDYSQRAKNKYIPLLAFATKISIDDDVSFM